MNRLGDTAARSATIATTVECARYITEGTQCETVTKISAKINQLTETEIETEIKSKIETK